MASLENGRGKDLATQCQQQIVSIWSSIVRDPSILWVPMSQQEFPEIQAQSEDLCSGVKDIPQVEGVPLSSLVPLCTVYEAWSHICRGLDFLEFSMILYAKSRCPSVAIYNWLMM